jgi:DNA-binding XRE family transcriptional regulator
MKIEGKLIRSGKWWAVEIPLLLIYTQGKTKKDAYLMAADAVEAIVDEKSFKVKVTEGPDNTFSVGSSNDSVLMALALKQQRAEHHLSVRDIAKRLGSNSPSAYSRYEQGKIKPSLDKFTQLLKAIDPSLEPILKVV